LGLLGPKKNVKGYEVGKRLVIGGEGTKKSKGSRHMSIEAGKLPSIGVKTPAIVISGHLKLSELLMNPNSESRQI
jgi:hypothetical protein